MSDVISVAIIAAIPGTVAAIMSFLNRSKLTQIHILFNSRVDELVKSKVAEALGRGHAEGVAQERSRDTSPPLSLSKKTP